MGWVVLLLVCGEFCSDGGGQAGLLLVYGWVSSMVSSALMVLDWVTGVYGIRRLVTLMCGGGGVWLGGCVCGHDSGEG